MTALAEAGLPIMDSRNGLSRPRIDVAAAIPTNGPDDDGVALTLAAAANGSLSNAQEERFYTVKLPGNAIVSLDGPDGADCDLYVKRDLRPTTDASDLRGFSSRPDETLRVTAGTSGLYHTMVRSYQGGGDFAISLELE